jgi:serine protease Do
MSAFDRFVVAFVLLLVTLTLFEGYSPDQGRRPLVPPPPSATAPAPPGGGSLRVRRPPLAAPGPQDPLVRVNTEGVAPGYLVQGTAFSVDDRGVWITARHVASAICQQLVLVMGRRVLPATLDYVDPQADLTVLRTREGAPAPAFATQSPEAGETGFGVGFPENRLGATEATLMGRSRMQLAGRLSGVTPTLTWAEDKRFPDDLPALSGMSGGPMFDDTGRIVGSVVAASERRGRVITVAPEVLHNVASATGLFRGGDSQVPEVAEDERLSDIANALNGNARIARVYCKPGA